MHSISKLVFLLCLAAAPVFATDLGQINVTASSKTIPVRISANSPQLEALAQRAFDTNGRYHVVTAGAPALYDLRFAWQGGTNVQVTVTRPDQAVIASQAVTGTSAYNALLRAADVAVERTNGLGLRGYFASKIAFVVGAGSHKEVYVSDLFFTEVRRITSDGRDAIFPRWSPDGTRLVYTSYLHGFPDLFEINLNSYQRTDIAHYTGTNMGGRFSPNGAQLAMVLSSSGSPEIWVGDSLGHSPRRLTRSQEAKSSPCFSPDGSRIVYAQEPGPQLYEISSYGGYPQRLMPVVFGYCAEPDWIRTEHGDRLVFTARGRDTGGYQIATYDFSGEPKVASRAPFDALEPSWLPDGRHVVYTARDSSDDTCLCILDTESGKSTRISPRSLGRAMQASVLRR